MKFEFLGRVTGNVLYSQDIPDGLSETLRCRAALELAVKAGADLGGAYLGGAIDPKDIPVIPDIDAAILAAIDAGGRLDMSTWHGVNDEWCGTTHCRAGWAVHLAGEKGKALQDRVGPHIAGAMIYRASRPGVPTPWFFDSNENTIADLRKCAGLVG